MRVSKYSTHTITDKEVMYRFDDDRSSTNHINSHCSYAVLNSNPIHSNFFLEIIRSRNFLGMFLFARDRNFFGLDPSITQWLKQNCSIYTNETFFF